jgi:outer membrane protein TolC
MVRSDGNPWLARPVWLFVLVAGCAVPLASYAQPPAPPVPATVRPVQDNRRKAQEPKKADNGAAPGPAILPPFYGNGLLPAVGVSLLDVLRLTALGNLDIRQAQLVVEQARAQQLRARVQAVPTLLLGSTYVAHDGQLQNTAGNVQDINRDSLFVRGGPTLTLSFADAVFGPREATSLLEAARHGQLRVTNDTLLQAADAHFTVLLARRRLAARDEGLEFLTSEQTSILRGRPDDPNRGLLPFVKAFVRAGTIAPADQSRVEADVVQRTDERIRLLTDVRTASAELARILHMDSAGIFLIPIEDFRRPVPIAGTEWCDQPLEILVGQALRNRPELFENRALIEAALARYRAAQWRPLLPNLVVNYAWGGFGGGPAIIGRTAAGANVFGPSGVIADFNTRSDFDITLVWQLQNMGLGNLWQQREARAAHERTIVRQLQIQDLVVSQVVQALEAVVRARQRVEVTRAGLFDEQGRPNGVVYRSISLNFQRVKGGEGRPLELVDSVRRLFDALEGYAFALTDYDRARFRLLVALGLPPAALLDPKCMPIPPAHLGKPEAPAPEAPSASAGQPAVPPQPTRLPPPVPLPPPKPVEGRKPEAPARDTWPALKPPDDGLGKVPGMPVAPIRQEAPAR